MATPLKQAARPYRVAGRAGARRRRGAQPLSGRAAEIADHSARRLEAGSRLRERERRLNEAVLTTWAALRAGHPVECPVCGGPLTAADGCSGCGSQLS